MALPLLSLKSQHTLIHTCVAVASIHGPTVHVHVPPLQSCDLSFNITSLFAAMRCVAMSLPRPCASSFNLEHTVTCSLISSPPLLQSVPILHCPRPATFHHFPRRPRLVVKCNVPYMHCTASIQFNAHPSMGSRVLDLPPCYVGWNLTTSVLSFHVSVSAVILAILNTLLSCLTQFQLLQQYCGNMV